MAQVFSEDAYIIGLIYSYLYAGKNKVSLKTLKEFYNELEHNLKGEEVFDMYRTLHFNSEDLCYKIKDKYNEEYLCLNPDVDLERAINIYVNGLSKATIRASIKSNTLRCLGLKRTISGIKPISIEEQQMKETSDYINEFIEKLKSGEISINTELEKFNSEHVVKELEIHKKLINNGIIQQLPKTKTLKK